VPESVDTENASHQSTVGKSRRNASGKLSKPVISMSINTAESVAATQATTDSASEDQARRCSQNQRTANQYVAAPTADAAARAATEKRPSSRSAELKVLPTYGALVLKTVATATNATWRIADAGPRSASTQVSAFSSPIRPKYTYIRTNKSGTVRTTGSTSTGSSSTAQMRNVKWRRLSTAVISADGGSGAATWRIP
jgi:hypothetical protein